VTVSADSRSVIRSTDRIALVTATAAATVLLALFGAERGADGAASADKGAHATGVLCLRKLPPPNAFATERKGSSGPFDEDTSETRARRMAGDQRLAVSVDRGADVIVDQKVGACIDGLALDVKHVVRSVRPGVSRQWGRFSFEPGQPVLELRYDPFYGNVHVDTPPWLAAKTAGISSCAACDLAPAARKKREVGSLVPEFARNARRERSEQSERWPKPATLTGPEPQMLELPKMEGLTILDHGQRRVPPDRWQIQAVIHNAQAAAALRARGIQVELGEAPTEQELKKDLPAPDAPATARPRP